MSIEIPKNWSVRENSLFRDYVFDDFKKALIFVNNVGELAENKNHHPDISIFSYCNVQLCLRTHDEGNIFTQKDIDMAYEINNL